MSVMKELRDYFSEIMRLNYILALLGWDHQVNMMGYKNIEGRSEQMALITKLIHTRLVSEKTGKIIKQAEKFQDLNDIDRAMLREAKRAYDQETKLPEALVVEIQKTAALAQQTWQNARRNNDFKSFIPLLEKTLELQREKAAKLETHPDLYSTLIDLYEPGATYDWIANIFNPIKPKLINFVKTLDSAPNKPNNAIFDKKFDPDKQYELSYEILKKLNYDFESGRQDRSTHPFTTSLGSLDVRITTRTTEPFPACITGTIHECGHALYEMGIVKELHDTILCTGTSMGIHESQSRMWENIVGRSKEFWIYWYPTFQKYFPEHLKDYPLEDFHRAVNYVHPSFIRVEADEVTYGLHIILRFEIEKDLIDGNIGVNELPEIWNSRFEELLGIVPPNDALGVLQDTHWGSGYIGYFPTYFLGNLYCAQIYDRVLKKMPHLPEDYKKGEFSNLLNYLREEIHQYGSIYRANDLIKRVTDEDLNPDYFMEYLEKKYKPIYGL
ncbi:MAG: carboxypeptidase M32 [Candidatus Lokiarchaeota archaeon]|nr:carboxypeptidase M32 [Candidatus Lokiarchaeota archaeon]